MKISLTHYPIKSSMLVRYWQPWREMEVLRRQLDRVFDDLSAPQNQTPAWTPAIELKDTGNEFILRVQLPGLDAKAIDIQVTKEAVLITGEHRQEEQTQEQELLKSEFRYGQFRRVVALPVAVQNDQVQADYNDGILTLTLPKVVAAQNRVVKVNLTAFSETPADTTEAIGSTEAVNR